MKTLFIVEDDEFYLQYLTVVLSRKYEVSAFTSAEDCMKATRHKSPDIIITDYYLPGINGFDMLQILTKKLPDTKFITLSSIEDGNLVLELIRKGIRNYVIKDEDVFRNIDETLADTTYQY